MTSREKFEPLEVKCTSSDCANDLHCFKATREMREADKVGSCRECGGRLVDWERVHQNDLCDVEYTFEAMRMEFIRHHFWHTELDQRAINYALRKGKRKLHAAVRSRIEKSIGPSAPFRDGQQTPFAGSGNPIHYAQHATASCCRTCVEYWHNVPRGRSLSVEEIDYLSKLCFMYLDERISNMTEFGEHIPPIRSHK